MTNRSKAYFLALLASLLFGLVCTTFAESETPQRPNILFFLVDDQRNDTLGCAGHPIVKTPAIDNMARAGIRFENAFVTTSICAASRASFLTGLHERTHGYTFGKPALSQAHMAMSYPMLLRKAGYRTGFVGKYGVATKGKPEGEMFDVFTPHGRNPYFKKQADGSLRHETEIAGDKAIAFLKEQPEGKPFCLSVSFNAVHAEDGDKKNHFPWPKAVDGLYDDVDIPAPRLADPEIYEKHPAFMKNSMNRQRFFWRWDTPEKYQHNIKSYFRMISGVDHVVGRVQKALQELELADNTVIIYMGDNGYYMGDRGFAGKWSHYEQSLRVPLVIHDPRSAGEFQGLELDSVALNIDVPATMLDLAGVPIPASYQGRSLVALQSGDTPSDWRSDFFCEHLMEHKAIPQWEGVRDTRYVYARYFGQDPDFVFLHDLEADPDQLVNLANNPEYRNVLQQMSKRCDAFKSRYEQARD